MSHAGLFSILVLPTFRLPFRKKELIFAMKNEQFTAQYHVALEGTDNGFLDTNFSVAMQFS